MPRTTKEKTQSMESDSDAGPTCMTTRARNATVHPGNIVRENLGVRRSKEEVQQEKVLKNARKTAKNEKKANAEALKIAGQAFVANLEMEEAVAAANAESDFPRHRTVRGMGSLLWRSILDCFVGKTNVPDKRKAAKRKASLDEGAIAPVRLLELYSYTTHCFFYQTQGEQGDTDPETSPSPPTKKVKPNVGQVRPPPLRRTGRSVYPSCHTCPTILFEQKPCYRRQCCSTLMKVPYRRTSR